MKRSEDRGWRGDSHQGEGVASAEIEEVVEGEAEAVGGGGVEEGVEEGAVGGGDIVLAKEDVMYHAVSPIQDVKTHQTSALTN